MKTMTTVTTSIVTTGLPRSRRARAHLVGAHRLLPAAAHAAAMTTPSGI